MKNTVYSEKYGEIVYEESAWTGGKSLYINGQQLEKTDRNTFKTVDGELITVKGNFLIGSKLIAGEEDVVLTPSIKWYEIVLSILPFLFDMIWGNIISLVKIFPIVAGAIGGFICAAVGVINLIIIKKFKNVWIKIAISAAAFIIAMLICFLLALAILSAVRK